jgi:hypothetical protein
VDEERDERRSPPREEQARTKGPEAVADSSSASASRALADRIAAGGTPPPRPVPIPDERHGAHDRRQLALVGLAVAVALLVVALAGTSYLALTNKSRAGEWEDRTLVLERHVDGLNGLLVERSNLLDARTRELNRMATTVERQQSALSRSEADVSTLEERQRELANEKAQLEDSRAQLAIQATALENVAEGFLDCNSGLVQLLGYLVDEDYGSANAVFDGVVADCQRAEGSLADYNATYP